MRGLLPLIPVLLLAAAPAVTAPPDPEARLARLVGDRRPGEPVQCITVLPNTNSTTIEGLGVVYQSGSTYYLNRFDRGCPQLTDDSLFITRQQTSQLCRGDIAIIQTNAPPSIPKGSCAFGAFTPYDRAKGK